MTSAPQPPRAPVGIVTAEGALAAVFNILTGGAFLTGLALLWGANDFQIGLLIAIPFVTPIAQLGATYLINRSGARKRITVLNTAVGRQVWWLLIPFLFIPCGYRIQLLIGIVIVCSLAMNAATVGWMSWIADLVPEKTRGRFFANRNVAVSIATLVATMLGGIVLDHYHETGCESTGFAVILAAAGIFAFVSILLLQRTPDHPSQAARGWEHLFEPLRIPRFRHLVRVFFVWNFSVGISAGFMAPHMLTNLGMSFTRVSLYTSAVAVTAILMNRPWGALIDRFGCKPVITLTSFGAAAIPLIWLLPTKNCLWILIPELLFAATIWTGFNLAAFNIPIANSPTGRRTAYLALFSMITGLAFFTASLLGGTIAESLSGRTWEIAGRTFVNYHVLFILAATLRVGAAFYARTFHEPEEKRVIVMIQFMGYAMLRALSVGLHIFPWPPKRQTRRAPEPIPIPAPAPEPVASTENKSIRPTG